MAKPSKSKRRKRTSPSGKKAPATGGRKPAKKSPKSPKATKRNGAVRAGHVTSGRGMGKDGKRGNVKVGFKSGVSGRKVPKKKVDKKPTSKKPFPKPAKRKPATKKPTPRKPLPKSAKRKPATKKPTPRKPFPKPAKRKPETKKPTPSKPSPKPAKRKPAAKKPTPRKPSPKPTKRKSAVKKPTPRKRPPKPVKRDRKPPTKKPAPKPKKRLPLSQSALLAEERAIEWLSRLMSFIDAGNIELGAMPGELSLGIKSFVNLDGTVDAEIRISDLPHLWQTEEGRVAMSEFMSTVLRKAGVLLPEKESGGYFISIGIRFGRAGNVEDLAELYKRHRGLFQVAAHPTSMHFISGIMNNVVSISIITDSLRKKRGLPPAVIFLRVTWTPTGERPERYLGERGGGN